MPASSGSRRQLVVEAIYDGSSINQGVRPSQQAIRGLSDDVQRVSNEFRLGAISADKYAAEMLGIRNSAIDMAQGLNRSSQEYRELTSAAIRADNELDKFGRTANKSTSAVDLLKGGVAALGVAFGVQEIARYGAEIGQLAEGADKTSRALNALSGGQATSSINALTTALDGSVSRMEAARIASALFATGVADSSAEAAHFAEVAAALGSTVGTDVATSIEFLRLAIDNLSYDRLGELGLSSDAVRTRVQALKEEGLSLGEAFKLATLAEAEARFLQLEQAGIQVGTSTDRLSAAWANLSLTLGNQVSPAYQGATDALASGLTFIDQNANAILQFDQTARNLLNPLAGVTQALYAQAEAHDKTVGSIARQTEEIEKQIGSTDRGIGISNIFGDALSFVGDAVDTAANNMPRLQAEAEYLADKFYGVTLSANAAAIAIGNAFGASADRFSAVRNKIGRSEDNPFFRLGDGNGSGLGGSINFIFEEQAAAFKAATAAAAASSRSGVSAAEKAKREHERIAREIAQAYEREYNRIGGFVDSALSLQGGVRQFDDLLDRTGVGRNENASNETIRRLEDVRDRALEGQRSPWITEFLGLDDANLEVTAARAERLIRDIQDESKFFELIPFDKFLQDVRELEAAEQRRAAFRDKAIQALGVGSAAAVDKALGIEGQGEGSGEALAQNIITSLEAGIEAEQARFRALGSLGATLFEDGFEERFRGIVQRVLSQEMNALTQGLAA